MKRKITQELVFELADQLSSQGIDPTNMKIRDLNDNHGSLTTITPHLKAWRDTRAAEGVEAIPDMPEEKLLLLLRPVWSELAREAKMLFVDEKERLENENKAIVEQSESLAREVDRQDAEIERRESQCDDLRHQLTDSQDAKHQQERAHTQEQAALREQLVTKTAVCSGLEEKLADRDQQCNELRQQLNNSTQALNQQEKEHAKALAVLAGLEEKLAEKEQQLTLLTENHNETKQALSQQINLTGKAEQAVTESKAKLAEVNDLRTKENLKSESKLAEANSLFNVTSDKLATTTAELSARAAELVAANQRVIDVEVQRDKAEARANDVLQRFLDTAGTWQEKLANNPDNELDQVTIFDELKQGRSGEIAKLITNSKLTVDLTPEQLTEFIDKFTTVVHEKVEDGYQGDIAKFESELLDNLNGAAGTEGAGIYFNIRKIRTIARDAMKK